MARPLRIDQAGGWYHITSLRNERGSSFRDDPDRIRFLELLGEFMRRWIILSDGETCREEGEALAEAESRLVENLRGREQADRDGIK